MHLHLPKFLGLEPASAPLPSPHPLQALHLPPTTPHPFPLSSLLSSPHFRSRAVVTSQNRSITRAVIIHRVTRGRIRYRPRHHRRHPRYSRILSTPPPSLTPTPKGMAALNPFQKLTIKIIRVLQIKSLRLFCRLHFPTLFPNRSSWEKNGNLEILNNDKVHTARTQNNHVSTKNG